ncbi:Glucose-repressible alcohol dehydrogenase transcriptional effector [Clydaea vesicula]|uniref:CCR4-Not complex 3'-5'-exoribonuclease subunit Ccr4 n=1 Tax=Clydaea vesicula TaxID=447962 RepID=A0AAD5U0P8_9FUNG|nr:Glucose-repressible alcohol dehydrogenase transcriptional effector [Clydaea vesicula]KAJ3396532.1 Glucose-repressible alcohol dehydrogenase transcriptional effector [Lobulomyces angularis]
MENQQHFTAGTTTFYSQPGVSFNSPKITPNSPQQHSYSPQQQRQYLSQFKATLYPTSNSPVPSTLNLQNNFQKQLDKQILSRSSNSPHHHARLAIATARQNQNVEEEQQQLENAKASDWTAIDLGGMQIRNLSFEIFKYEFLTTLYLNHNNLTRISPECHKLRNLKVLDLSGNKLASIPPELGMLTNLVELLLFDNELTVLPHEFGALFQLDILGLEGNPLSEPIVSLSQKDGAVGVIQYLRDSCPVGPQPPEREWISLEEDVSSASNQIDNFTLLCYNALCDKYATPGTYPYTPSWVLNWEYRKDLLLQEILNYNADIVCLQEVESLQYDEYFREQMSQHGDYDGIFYPKSRARTMDEYSRKSVDGCATFWKSSKFSLIEKQLIEFQQIAMQRPELRKTEDIFNRVMVKDNIAVVTLLEAKDTSSRLLVANAHLHWDPQYKDVKLVQTAMLMEELQHITHAFCNLPSRHPQHKYLQQNPLRLPTILCGDFNSLPQSGVYEFLSRSTCSQDHEDFGQYKYGRYTSEGLKHKFNLRSAYSHINELEFTNFTPSFKGCIDFIWYSTSSLVVTGLLANVDETYLEKCVGFPNWHHPSDHIPLLSSFSMKNINVGNNKNTNNNN